MTNSKTVKRLVAFVLAAILIAASFMYSGKGEVQAASKEIINYYNGSFWTYSDEQFIYIQGDDYKLTRYSKADGKLAPYEVTTTEGKFLQAYEGYLYYVTPLKTKKSKVSQSIVKVEIETGKKTTILKKTAKKVGDGELIKALNVSEKGILYTYSTYKKQTTRENGVNHTVDKETKKVYRCTFTGKKNKVYKKAKFKADKNIHPVESEFAKIDGNGFMESTAYEFDASARMILKKSKKFKLKVTNLQTNATEKLKVTGTGVEYAVVDDYILVLKSVEKADESRKTYDEKTLYIKKYDKGKLKKIL